MMRRAIAFTISTGLGQFHQCHVVRCKHDVRIWLPLPVAKVVDHPAAAAAIASAIKQAAELPAKEEA